MHLTILACLTGLTSGAHLVDVVLPGGADALPLTCGVLAPSSEGAGAEALVWLEDEAHCPVPAVVHRRPGRRVLHAILPAGSGGGVLRISPSPPGGATAPRILAGTGASDREAWTDTGTGRIDLGPGTVVRTEGVTLRVFPGPADGRWTLVHHCPLRAELLCQGTALESRGEVSLLVTTHAGSGRVDLALLMQLSEATTLPEGAGIELETGRELPLRLGEAVVVGHPDRERHLAWSEGAWWEGEDRSGAAPRGMIGFGSAPGLWLTLPSGREEGFESLEIAAGGRSVRLLWAAPGTRLDAGDGRIFRALHGSGPSPPAPAPLIIPGVPSRAAAALHPGLGTGAGSSTDALAAAAADLVADFLADPARGLILSGPGAGDWRMDRENVGNLEYDTVLGLLGFGASARAPSAFHQAQASADHLLGQDLDRLGTGLFFEHGGAHRSGRTETGHHWLEGPILLDLWLDDPLRARVLDAALARQIATFAALDPGRLFPRCLGWGLRALTAGASRAADRGPWLRELRRWRRRILSAQSRSGLLLLGRDPDEAHLFRESPFVQGGIIAPALAVSTMASPDPDSAASASRLARFLVEGAIHRTKEGWFLAETLVYDARAGRAVGRSGRAPGEEAALFLAGVLRACPALTGDAAVAGLRDTLAGRLAASRRRFIGRELSLLLRALPGLRN